MTDLPTNQPNDRQKRSDGSKTANMGSSAPKAYLKIFSDNQKFCFLFLFTTIIACKYYFQPFVMVDRFS